MKELTVRQTEVLEFIKNYRTSHSYSPSTRDVAAHFSMSVRGAYDHIRALCKKGHISADRHRSRSLCIIQDSGTLVKIPLVGNVAAGLPLLAEENMEGFISIPETSIGKGTHFALHVKGDSMKDAGILNGDIAIILKQATAENGNIVAAQINGEAITLKRFFLEKNRIRLQAENQAYPPIYAQNVKVVGRLVQIMRNYD